MIIIIIIITTYKKIIKTATLIMGKTKKVIEEGKERGTHSGFEGELESGEEGILVEEEGPPLWVLVT